MIDANNIREHMKVVGSDGAHVGTVDKLDGDLIILTKSDSAAGGQHHAIPMDWVEDAGETLTLNRSAEEAFETWSPSRDHDDGEMARD